MYSQELQEMLSAVSQIGKVNPVETRILQRSLLSYLQMLARYLHADINPSIDRLGLTLDSLFLSDALSKMNLTLEVESGHYLIAMAFEQSGELLSRKVFSPELGKIPPLKNNIWYQLLLSFLHYLAGGYRVQAKSVLNKLDTFCTLVNNTEYYKDYELATGSIRKTLTEKPSIILYFNGSICSLDPLKSLLIKKRK